jgi:hypothetical protein
MFFTGIFNSHFIYARKGPKMAGASTGQNLNQPIFSACRVRNFSWQNKGWVRIFPKRICPHQHSTHWGIVCFFLIFFIYSSLNKEVGRIVEEKFSANDGSKGCQWSAASNDDDAA